MGELDRELARPPQSAAPLQHVWPEVHKPPLRLPGRQARRRGSKVAEEQLEALGGVDEDRTARRSRGAHRAALASVIL